MLILQKLRDSAWYQKWIWRKRPRVSFGSVAAMRKELNDEAPFQKVFLTVKYRLIRLWEWPGDRLFDLRMYHERGTKGWAKSDAWGFHAYLSRVIVEGLEWLKENKHGCPIIDGYDDGIHVVEDDKQADARFEATCQEWDRRLDCMIFAFKVTQEVLDHDLIIPQGSDYFTPEELTRYEEFCARVNKRDEDDEDDIALKVRIISREEFAKYELGWRYFKDHYFGLWD